MTKPFSSFSIIHNLESLVTEKEGLASQGIIKYLCDASVYFGLDPLLNALDVIWMNDENGRGRKLVVYARKGTTDILRGIHGIEVTSLVQFDSAKYVSFTATGKNNKGRQEIAVGAHSIEGLGGERLAYAVMTAQTRALRRLTLQFVGGGLLDESEVNAQPTLNAAPAASQATLAGSPMVFPPMPKLTPNQAPGRVETPAEKELTQVATAVEASTETDIPVETSSALPAENKTPKLRKPRSRKPRNTVDINVPGEAEVPKETPQEFSERQEQMRQEAIRQLGKDREPADPTNPIKGWVSYPEHGTISIQSEMPRGQIDANGVITAPVINTKTEFHVPLPPHVGETVVGIPTPKGDLTIHSLTPTEATMVEATALKIVSLLRTPEKAKEYRDRLSKYSMDILPGAGMMPSENIGGVTMKLRKFAQVSTGNSSGNYTPEQWEGLFAELDGILEAKGAAALVAHINKTLGVA